MSYSRQTWPSLLGSVPVPLVTLAIGARGAPGIGVRPVLAPDTVGRHGAATRKRRTGGGRAQLACGGDRQRRRTPRGAVARGRLIRIDACGRLLGVYRTANSTANDTAATTNACLRNMFLPPCRTASKPEKRGREYRR